MKNESRIRRTNAETWTEKHSETASPFDERGVPARRNRIYERREKRHISKPTVAKHIADLLKEGRLIPYSDGSLGLLTEKVSPEILRDILTILLEGDENPTSGNLTQSLRVNYVNLLLALNHYLTEVFTDGEDAAETEVWRRKVFLEQTLPRLRKAMEDLRHQIRSDDLKDTNHPFWQTLKPTDNAANRFIKITMKETLRAGDAMTKPVITPMFMVERRGRNRAIFPGELRKGDIILTNFGNLGNSPEAI